jgi:2-hydroxy-6-oxonona-2,4-dienedioate hydrolase
MEIRFVDISGVRTRCLLAGSPDAYPLVLLHGYGGTADVWFRNIDVLGREFRVVAPDMIGSGFTDPVDTRGRPPQAETVRHLCGLADQLGLERFCAVGTSYGGLIGALMHFAMPERVDRLVFVGSGSAFNDDDRLAATYRNVRDIFVPLLKSPSLETCREFMRKQCVDPASLPEEILPVMVTAYAQPWMRASVESGLAGLLRLTESRPWQIRHRLEEITASSLLVWGRGDKGAPVESAAEAARRMPRARLVVFEKSAHKPMYEEPDRFNRALDDFIRSTL